jgi:DNA segregation ATPase FtsK/SpoIIIE, S-DNA-T family
MSSLDLQQILSSRFRTSGDADRYTANLMQGLGLSTKANVARLAIGRSLSLGPLKEDGIDSKGLDIPAQSLFSQSDIAVWVGLIVTHAKKHGEVISNMDGFRNAVRQHWHRGATLLMEDWQAENGDFDKFMGTLINRRAELPDTATPPISTESQKTKSAEKPVDVSAQLIRAMSDIGVVAEVKGLTHGPRVSRYKVFLPDINQLDKLRKGLERLSLVLSLSTVPTLARGDETKTVFLDIPRSKETWESAGFGKLKEWVQSSQSTPDQLIVYPGINVIGKPFSLDLTSAPHLLVGGATGMGKSVCLHALILSLIMKHSTSNLKLALIDPKQVEFSVKVEG